jgi:glycine C-acetyltransferase
MLDQGVFVTGFGYPVVPDGTARIRSQVSAVMRPEHLERAVETMSAAMKSAATS